MSVEGTQIALLNRETLSHAEILKTLATATHEMGKVTNSIERMLMLHDQRITNIDRGFVEVKHNIEKHEEKINREVQDMYDHIQKDSTELMTKMGTSEAAILKKMDDMMKALQAENKLMDGRISALEKWKYGLLMVGGVIGFLLHQGLPLFTAFLLK